MDAIYGRKQHRQGEGNLSGKKKSSTTDACILSGLNTLCFFFPWHLPKKQKKKKIILAHPHSY
jgi:16S rRNA C1402 (ribose-2'-O) methylase RsmI